MAVYLYLRDFMSFAGSHRRFLAFGLLTAFSSSFGQSFFIGSFSNPIMTSFDLSRAQYGALYSLATFCSALLLPITGRPIDGTPLKRYTSIVAIGLVTACLLMAWSPSLVVLVVAFFALRQSGQGLMSHISTTSVARAFQAERGRALSIAVLGYPIGQAFLPLTVVALTAYIGWRQTWVVCAAIVAFLLLPTLRWLLRGAEEDVAPGEAREAPDAAIPATTNNEGAPQGLATEPDAALRLSERQWTRAEVLRDLRFWLVTPAAVMPAFIITAIFIHQTFIPGAKGWSTELWTALFVVLSSAQIAFSLLAGPLVDRFTARAMLPFFLLPMGLGLLILAFGQTIWLTAVIFLFLIGCTAGLSMTLGGALWAELYGVAHLGAIRSVVASFAIVSTAAAPFISGWLIDLGVSLTMLSLGSALLVGLAILGVMAGLALPASTS